MDKVMKRKWVKALRSSKYGQAVNALHIKDDGFCCLGVLCDIVDPDAWGAPKSHETLHLEHNRLAWKGSVQFLPQEIATAYSIKLKVKLEEEEDIVSTLMAMNDQEQSFNEIADYIEEKL